MRKETKDHVQDKWGIRLIFPLYLSLLVNYPLLLGLVLNYPLVDFRLFLINILWQTAFVIVVRFLKSNFIYKIGLLVYGFTSFIESLHWIILKSPLSPSSVFVVAATNFQESVDFLSLKIGFRLILLVPLIIFFILSWKKQLNFAKFRHSVLIQSILLLVFVIFVFENASAGRLVRKGIPQFAKVFLSYQQERLHFQEAMAVNKLQLIDAETEADKQTIVLILGESSNRNHWQLYGNPNKTTPLLSKRSDLFIFDNVISAYSNTISSITTSLSEKTVNYQASTGGGIDIFDVFKSAGYTTYWISNQTPIGVWENLVTVFARKADYTVFVNLAANSSMESTMIRSYDELLFSPVEKIVQMDDPLKLIIVHTMGNHSSYRKRYPPSFDQFKGNDAKTQTIAEYHNSILYHDYFLDSLLNIVAGSTNKSAVLYVSDHGENVYDENNEVGHTYAGRLPKANVEVPFFFWFSDAYSNSLDTKILSARKSAPYLTDNLFHTLIELGNINASVFNPAVSLLNPDFDFSRQRILEDGYDYDHE